MECVLNVSTICIMCYFLFKMYYTAVTPSIEVGAAEGTNLGGVIGGVVFGIVVILAVVAVVVVIVVLL